MGKIAFISYYFDELDGVGSARSRALAKLLESKGKELTYFEKNSLGTIAAKYNIVWGLLCFIKLVKNTFDIIYVSCGPFWPLLYILFASKIKKMRIIIDFRDPWSPNIKTSYGKPNAKVNWLKYIFALVLEKLIYKSCEYFWVCTPGMKREYETIFNDSSKIRLVINGYNMDLKDLNLQNKVIKKDEEETIRFVCLGKFAEYDQIKAKRVLCELQKLVDKKGSASIKIDFVGTDPEPTQTLIREIGLENQVHFYPRMPYADALRIAAQAHFGLVLLRNETLDFGTKVYDYIGLNIPIFDYFDRPSEFTKFFKDYITKDRHSNISFAKKEKFKRDNIFKCILDCFDIKEDNQLF